jgi:hypothetical protein
MIYEITNTSARATEAKAIERVGESFFCFQNRSDGPMRESFIQTIITHKASSPIGPLLRTTAIEKNGITE